MSEMGDTYETIIQQTTDNCAPPEMPVLRVSVIADEVALEIADMECGYEDGTEWTKLTNRAVAIVRIDALIAALGIAPSAERLVRPVWSTPADNLHRAWERASKTAQRNPEPEQPDPADHHDAVAP